MPKDKRGCSHSSSRSRTSPYPCSSGHAVQSSTKNSDSEDVKEWEEVRCPVCMEHPHNAVLLQCSSHEKGCHPYMCDTSYRHSNCLDQFRKAFAETPTLPSQDETFHLSGVTLEASPISLQERTEAGAAPEPTLPCDDKTQLKLTCPLCRGQVNGWIVVEPARRFMNAKARSCACETCDFTGTYADLRKHARVEHPLVRPSQADPERQRDWRRMEQDRDLRDVLSTFHSAFGEERSEDGTYPPSGTLLSLYIVLRVSQVPISESGASSSWPSSPSRSRVRLRSRRRTSLATLWGEDLDTETDSDAREGENGSSEGVSSSRHQRNQRRRMD